MKTNENELILQQKPGITFVQTDLDNIFGDENVVLVGDLNAKNQLWECHQNDRAGEQLERYTEEINLAYPPEDFTRIPTQNNHKSSMIDIVIAKSITIHDIQTYHDLPSDHNPVVFHLNHNITTEENATIQKILYRREIA